MSEARKQAEEALASVDRARAQAPPVERQRQWAVILNIETLRSLLAEQGAGGANPDIPESCRVDEDGCCVVCGRTVIGDTCCSLAARKPLAPPPAPEAHGCPVEGEPGHESCAVCGHPFPNTETHAPSAAVREAAERDAARGGE